MSTDCLKLTTYFGERDRTGGELLADRLMDLFGERQVAASLLLRGIDGFGRLHHPHSDRLLSTSENLPVLALAVDERTRIEGLLGSVLAVKRRGLVTLERALLVSGQSAHTQPAEPAEGATKLTIYLGRQERVGQRPAHIALCELLHERGFAGASVFLGVDGTRLGCRSRARFFGRNSEVPLMLEGLATSRQVSDLLPTLSGLLTNPLMTLERIRICKRDGSLLTGPHEAQGLDEHGLATRQKLTVYSSHAALGPRGRPLHLELLQRLVQERTAGGATVLRGLWGFHGHDRPAGDRFFQVRRHVPVCTVVIDVPERAGRWFALIDEITAAHGLVISELVPAAQAISDSRQRGGLRLSRRRGA